MAAEATLASATPITPTPQDATSTPTFIPTLTASTSVIKADVLGCDTSVDITHGLGEVTNAYVTISNPTLSAVSDMCATLSALDEGQPHPDKTKCVPSLDSGYQLTLKLTVDTTYQQQTPIQIDITSQGNLLLRVGEPACTAIGLLLPAVSEIGIPRPIP